MRRVATWVSKIVLSLLSTIALTSFALLPVWAQQADTIRSNPLRNAYFGELHVHTSYSLDAFMNGNRHDPEVAYRFARGEPLTLYGGETTQLRVPLDFIAITNHAESFGDLSLCKNPDSAVYDNSMCQGMRTIDRALQGRIIGDWRIDGATRVTDVCGDDGHRCIDASKDTWRRSRELAEQFNDPGTFTTLVAYEYSPHILTPLAKVHRNVIFRTADVPETVFSAFDGTAEDCTNGSSRRAGNRAEFSRFRTIRTPRRAGSSGSAGTPTARRGHKRSWTGEPGSTGSWRSTRARARRSAVPVSG